MTSLPTPYGVAEPADAAVVAAASRGMDEKFLLQAFSSFSEAAGSLERSYSLLRGEVARLRQELEASHAGLAESFEENRRMRERLDRILESLPCGVLVVTSEGKISRANPEARRLLELSAMDADEARTAAGDPAGSLCSLPAETRSFLESTCAEGGEHEQLVTGPHGPANWLAARHATVPEGDTRASVFILRDIGERKRLEQAESKMRREQALAEISAVLAHEIRNPLASMELFAGLLAEADLGGECRQWVEHVQAGLRTLGATVNNVLHFHSQPEVQRAAVDLGQLLDWARAFFAPLARQARIEISLHNHLAGVVVFADRHRLEQVLANLVLNAVRAMPGGGWIELAGQKSGEGASLRVADTGPGIALAQLEEIFQAGFSTRPGSPGLGLTVCRKIVEQHGGTIEAASPPGRGATFTITFAQAQSSVGGEAAA